MIMASPFAPRFCFCKEVEHERKTAIKLRIMGTLVRTDTTNAVDNQLLHDLKDDKDALSTPSMTTILQVDEDSYTQILVLDDGTGSTVSCLASDQMAQAVQVGMTLDCVVRNARRRRRNTDPLEENHNDNGSSALADLVEPLVMEMLIIVKDGAQALTLRSLEIMHQRQGFPGKTWGFTHHQAPFTMDDINDIIQAEAEMGVSLDDLYEMFDVDKSALQEMIQELQMQGLIYQSKSGAYMPL